MARDNSRRTVSSAVKPDVERAMKRYAEDTGETRSRAGEELLRDSLERKGYLEPRSRGGRRRR